MHFLHYTWPKIFELFPPWYSYAIEVTCLATHRQSMLQFCNKVRFSFSFWNLRSFDLIFSNTQNNIFVSCRKMTSEGWRPKLSNLSAAYRQDKFKIQEIFLYKLRKQVHVPYTVHATKQVAFGCFWLSLRLVGKVSRVILRPMSNDLHLKLKPT